MHAEQVYIQEIHAHGSPSARLSPGDLPRGRLVAPGPSPGLGAQNFGWIFAFGVAIPWFPLDEACRGCSPLPGAGDVCCPQACLARLCNVPQLV